MMASVTGREEYLRKPKRRRHRQDAVCPCQPGGLPQGVAVSLTHYNQRTWRSLCPNLHARLLERLDEKSNRRLQAVGASRFVTNLLLQKRSCSRHEALPGFFL